MMKLIELLGTLKDHELANVEITSITNDSRQIVAGSLFLAEQGIGSHGLDHLSLSQCEQASVVLYQAAYDTSHFFDFHHKMIAVENLNEKISEIAARFYSPHFSQGIIGVTGTNGKTSVSQFIAQLASYGVIGTMGYGFANDLTELSHTTPDSLSVQKILSDLSSQNCKGVAMEVSSHALSLCRVSAVPFSVAVFTNLSQDHLDFHKTMDDYKTAKSALFFYKSVNAAVINVDDEVGYQLAQECCKNNKRVLVFGKSSRAKEFLEHVLIKNVVLSDAGINCELDLNLVDYENRAALNVPIWGAFNVDNVLAAILALYANGEEMAKLLEKASALHGVAGRIEPIKLGDGKTAIIDYSHTPDALDNVLSSLRAHTAKKIYAVFGCGGDRDKSKRPLMAEAVSCGANIGIITDDNPRTENSEDIIGDILTGDIDSDRFQVIASRRDAIRFALSKLESGDIVLIAGKGHENYQIIGTEKNHFSDHEVVREWLAENAL